MEKYRNPYSISLKRLVAPKRAISDASTVLAYFKLAFLAVNSAKPLKCFFMMFLVSSPQ